MYAFEAGFVSTKITGIDVQPNSLREFCLNLQVEDKILEEIMVIAGPSRLETRDSSIRGSGPPGGVAQFAMEASDLIRGGYQADYGWQTTGIVGDPVHAPGTGSGPAIALRPWDPQTPYLKVLRQAGAEHAYDAYLGMRDRHGASPAFYFDCGQFFLDAGKHALGVRVLTAVADLDHEDVGLLRVLAHRLAQVDELELAADLFEKVRRMRPDEPQSLRDLALVLARREQYGRALELLHEVILGDWDGRFPEIEVIALTELNALLPRAEAAGLDPGSLGIDPRLIRLLDVDLRIVLTWDADATDMDLWVIEPSGAECHYRRPNTRIGGHLTEDYTEGYGPEEYMLRRAMPGTYKILVDYFGSNTVRLIGPVTLQVEIFTDYGRPEESRRSLTLRLTEEDDAVTVGEVSF
jgi:hypothetical protein